MTIKFTKHSINWKRDMPEAVQTCFKEVLRHEGTDRFVFRGTYMLEGYKKDFVESYHLALNDETRTQGTAWGLTTS